jgi:hypothetical protein
VVTTVTTHLHPGEMRLLRRVVADKLHSLILLRTMAPWNFDTPETDVEICMLNALLAKLNQQVVG